MASLLTEFSTRPIWAPLLSQEIAAEPKAVGIVNDPVWDEVVEKRICRGRRADLRSQIVAGSAS